MMTEIWFWQTMVSPHMAGLADAIALRGIPVHYVAEREMATQRRGLGWQTPWMGAAQRHLAGDNRAREQLVAAAGRSSIHVCQGVRSNGGVGHAQRLLSQRALQQWVVMETVDDYGWRGGPKRWEYRRLFTRARRSVTGVLATGYRTPNWVRARGFEAEAVFPFAYFLSDVTRTEAWREDDNESFRILFVGQLIARKRVDWLIRALGSLCDRPCEVAIVGSGPLEGELRSQAHAMLPGRVRWSGSQPSPAISAIMADADCLVLPSRHDGWGAVVSEALMVGTPVICSDACGSAGVVRASAAGSVFPADDFASLCRLLDAAIRAGRISAARRDALSNWARCLGASVGADYLLQILQGKRPMAPWEVAYRGGLL